MEQQKKEETIWCQKQIIIQQILDILLVIEIKKKTQILLNKPVYEY